MRFTDQVVVVTGAARGIGFAAAKLFSQEGAQVGISDLDTAAVDRAVSGVRTTGGRAFSLPADVSNEDDVRTAVQRVIGEYGRIDVLVNNAGIITRSPAHELESPAWHRALAINLDGVFFWSRAAARESMIPRRRGAIVNVASLAGLVAIPNGAAYVASKHAVVGLTKALALDWGRYNIRVNALCPGMTVTELSNVDRQRDPEMFVQRERRIPLGRAAQPEEQARAILFLASADASAVHGLIMNSDGGNMAMSSGASPPPPQP